MDGMNAGSVPAGSEEGVDGMDTAVMMIETVTDMDYDGRVVSSGPWGHTSTHSSAGLPVRRNQTLTRLAVIIPTRTLQQNVL